MKKQIIFDEDIEAVKNKLPKRCAYSTISEMLAGKYKPGTIKAMFNQWRTMSPEVLQAAQSLIEFITPEKNRNRIPTNKEFCHVSNSRQCSCNYGQ